MDIAGFARLVLLQVVAQTVITAGVFLIGGKLFPGFLKTFYDSTGLAARTAVALLLFLSAGNALMGYCYSHFPPAVVAPVSLFVLVVVLVAITALATGTKLSFWLVPATLIIAAGCAWVSFLLNVKA